MDLRRKITFGYKSSSYPYHAEDFADSLYGGVILVDVQNVEKIDSIEIITLKSGNKLVIDKTNPGYRGECFAYIIPADGVMEKINNCQINYIYKQTQLRHGICLNGIRVLYLNSRLFTIDIRLKKGLSFADMDNRLIRKTEIIEIKEVKLEDFWDVKRNKSPEITSSLS